MVGVVERKGGRSLVVGEAKCSTERRGQLCVETTCLPEKWTRYRDVGRPKIPKRAVPTGWPPQQEQQLNLAATSYTSVKYKVQCFSEQRACEVKHARAANRAREDVACGVL